VFKDDQQTPGLGALAPTARDAAVATAQPYESPRIIVLGTLADLTAGGAGYEDDGHGGAGASGVI
jgi:hypothetical protein